MRYALLFILLLPSVTAMGIGVSPGEITLSHGEGSFSLLNPNEYKVKYKIHGVLQERGTLEALEIRTFDISQPGHLSISFPPKKGDLRIAPSILLQVKESPQQKRKNHGMLIISIILGTALLLTIRFSLSYFSNVWNRHA